MKIPKDWDEYDQLMIVRILRNGDAVIEASYVAGIDLVFAKQEGTRWYRSKGKANSGINPFASYMLNKKWTLEEEFNNHMLRFQQVSAVTSIYFSKLHFHIPGWIDNH